MTDHFDAHLDAWTAHVATPWGRVRYAVVRHALAATLARLGAGPLRVLDVGGGDARDSLPLAVAGHDVTVLDPSARMLDAAEARAAAAGVPLRRVAGGMEALDGLGTFDVVLLHFVLHYRDDPAADLAAAVRAVRSGGMLSVAAPNPAGMVLGRLVRDGPAEALAELHRTDARTATFDHAVRKLTHEAVADHLAALGCTVVGRYGGRIATDLLTDNDAKHDPVVYAKLEALELALCDREPFWRIGAFWQLVAQVPG